jgi:hypothetical protein
MMASLQQAMQKGMPPDQAIQYVKSMATQGVAPLTDLYSMMNQFQRLKQQQAQAPQTPPTIRDQLNMAAQQQQMQSQGNIQQMQAPAPAGQPMDRGLGAIDAGRMEYPQFAGGGMVALAGGGDVIAFQDRGLVPEPYEFNDELSARVPSFMTSDMDIVSFVKRQMPNFDMLTPEQKQEVLRRFEPAYNQARAARLKLESRGAVETAAPVATSAPAQASAGQQLDFRNQNMALAAPNPFDSPDQQLGNVFEQLAIRPAESASVADERRPAAPRREVVAAPKKDRYEEFRYEKPDLEAIRREREERQKTQKTGAYSQADADLAAYIEEQKKQGGDTKEAYRNFWVMTGASLMANKSPNFLQALGESVKENYGGLIKDLKQLKDDTKAYRLEEIRLRQARERALETGDAADQSRYDSLLQRHENRQFDIFKTELGIQEKTLDRAHNERLAALRAAGNDRQADRLTRLWQTADAETDPYKQQKMFDAFQKELEITRDITEATTATGVGAGIRAETAAQERLTNLAKNDNEYRRLQRIASTSEDAQEVRDAQERMRMIEQRALGGPMGAGPRVDQGLTGGTYDGPYSVSGWER